MNTVSIAVRFQQPWPRPYEGVTPQPWRRVVADIAARNGLSPGEIMQRTRAPRISHARHEAMHALRQRGWSYPQIARVWGMDHTTALYGVRAFQRRQGEV